MVTISDEELLEAFQDEYPKGLTRTTEGGAPLEYDFDRIEAEKLMGIRWTDIKSDLFQDFFDIASWLSPQAFHYFFPAFIKQSQLEVEKTSLLVDALVEMLADGGIHWPEQMKDAESKLLEENPEIKEALDSINEKDLSARRQERWKLFTEQQWAIVRKWLTWLDQDERWKVDREVLRKAMKNAHDWQMNLPVSRQKV